MTPINHPVHRITAGEYSVLYSGQRRRIIVTLLPGDVLGFRESGRRQQFTLPIVKVFQSAVRSQAEADRQAKRQAKRPKENK